MSFLMQKQGSYLPTSAPSSPRKKSALVKTLASLIISRGEGSHANQSDPTSREFEEKIPIYNGRTKGGKPFTFTEDNFRELSSWPLYCDGAEDVPTDGILAVGYTLNTYAGKNSTVLSSNVQFVILLALPIPDDS